MQREIKFKRTGSNSVYGSFATGDVLRCDAALAAHYVREGVAKYIDVEPAPVVEPVVETKVENVRRPNKRTRN
jgi:hypothetical protein